uniref:Protein kinase domain-containing protein n=1 Tax=Aegilops tauschii subsp. strangulata TaxID=200361 RepID=A0A452YGP9_AEGTS
MNIWQTIALTSSSSVRDVEHLTGSNDLTSLLAWLVALHIFMKSSMLLPDDHSHLSTKFAGTLGYTAPEYAIHGQLSEKVDTYSFGVVILEIISGRKSNDTRLEPETQYLLESAWKLYENENLISLVDELLNREEYKPEEVKKIIEIALLCTQSAVASRPTMSEVVVLLLSRNSSELKPTRPTFIDSTSRVRGETSSSSSSSASRATVSISQFSAR